MIEIETRPSVTVEQMEAFSQRLADLVATAQKLGRLEGSTGTKAPEILYLMVAYAVREVTDEALKLAGTSIDEVREHLRQTDPEEYERKTREAEEGMAQIKARMGIESDVPSPNGGPESSLGSWLNG